jgi:hypothetical protein
MTHADIQQQRMLEQLHRASDQTVAFAELRDSGIDFPAAVVSELQLNGYAIDRAYERGRLVGVRLVKPEPPSTPAPSTAVAAAITSGARPTPPSTTRPRPPERLAHPAGVPDPIAPRDRRKFATELPGLAASALP